MVAHYASSCDSSAAETCSTRRRPAPALSGALATGRAPPPLPMSSSRSKRAAVNGGRKARTTTGRRRRCAEAMIRRKVEALRRLVPSSGGGDGTVEEDGAVEELLFRAANYIVRLQVQVKAMQLMVDVLDQHTKDDS